MPRSRPSSDETGAETPPAGASLRRREIKPRRGLRREEAALYIGISPAKFDELVKEGRMPRPKAIGKAKVYDILLLDIAFDALGEEPEEGAEDEGGGDDPWGKVSV